MPKRTQKHHDAEDEAVIRDMQPWGGGDQGFPWRVISIIGGVIFIIIAAIVTAKPEKAKRPEASESAALSAPASAPAPRVTPADSAPRMPAVARTASDEPSLERPPAPIEDETTATGKPTSQPKATPKPPPQPTTTADDWPVLFVAPAPAPGSIPPPFYDSAPAPRKKNCVKGIPCGNTCIAANKRCRQ